MRALTSLMFWIALLVCLAGWGRLAWVLLVGPSPARVMAFILDEHTSRDPADPPHCHGPVVVEGEAAWRVCAYRQGPGQAAAQDGLVRFDFVARRAEMFWPFPGPATGSLQGVARHPGGDLAALTLDGRLWIVRRAGGVASLGKAPPRVTGMAWVDDRLEVVDYQGAVVAFEGGQEPESLGKGNGPPEAPGWLDMLAVAEVTDAGWKMTWLRAPVRPDDQRPIVAELICGGVSEPPADCGQIPLSEQHYVLTAGQLTLVAMPLLPTGGNLLPNRARVPVFERGDPGWWPIAAPPGVTSPGPDEVGVLLGPSGLSPSPRFVHGAVTWTRVATGWLGVSAGVEGPSVLRATGSKGSPLAASRWLGAGGHLVPAGGGSFWLLGAFGTFALLGPDLERADGLDPVERVTRLYTDFHRLRPFSDFYLEHTELKMAVLPLVLLLWPLLAILLYLPLLRIRLPHWEGRHEMCYRVAAWIYVPLVGASAWWFWLLTGRL